MTRWQILDPKSIGRLTYQQRSATELKIIGTGDVRWRTFVNDGDGSVPPVRHHGKLTLAPLPTSVGAAVSRTSAWGLRSGLRKAEHYLLRLECGRSQRRLQSA